MFDHDQRLREALTVENQEVVDAAADTPAQKGGKPPRNPFKRRFHRVNEPSKRGKLYFYIAIGLLIAVGGGLLLWINSLGLDFGVGNSEAPAKKPPVHWYSPLSGVEVADEATTKRPVTAVMIENSPDARPQSGLADAEVVFEAVAEGGITRFIALYQTSRPELIGPVRSLRPYYADWAAGFDPSVAHVGGSPEALTMIRSGNYGVDIDQFFNAGNYWRASDRVAPHNVYTNSEKLDELVAAKGKTTSTYTFSPRVNEKKVDPPALSHIDVNVSSGIFNVSYDYDTATNSYHRRQGGEAHTDREKGQIAPKVVVVMKTNISLSADGQHMVIATSGSGTAYVFQNGTVTEGTWSKAGPREQLFFKDAAGKDIPLVRGQTWITTIDNARSVTWQ